jgi:hypothetical protein
MKKLKNPKVKVKCPSCGYVFPKYLGSAQDIITYPECKPIPKDIPVSIEDKITQHDCLRGKVKDTTKSRKENPRVDFLVGYDLRKKDNKFIIKSRMIDKDNNLYKETLKDPETNEVLYQCEELLSEHQGHGSTKSKRKKV